MNYKKMAMNVNRVSKITFVLYLSMIFQISHGLVSESTNNMHKNKNFTLEKVFELTTKSFTDKNESSDIGTDVQNLLHDKFSFIPPIVQKYGLKSEECVWRTSCDNNIDLFGRSCRCDKLCPIFDDCCENISNTTSLPLGEFPKIHQFDCYGWILRSNEIIQSNVVTKCSSEWNDSMIKDLCEKETDEPHVSLIAPVSDKDDIIYKNMYCAYCNFKFDFEFWTVEERCIKENDKPSCRLFYDPPQNASITKSCRKFDYVSECPLSANSAELNRKCEESSTNFVYTLVGNKYRNKYCALCNGADEKFLLCFPDTHTTVDTDEFIPPNYSFRILVDLNIIENVNTMKSCRNNHMYDPISKTCKQIFCPQATINFNGRCIPEVRMFENETDTNTTTCAFIKLNSDEWKHENESAIYVLALDRVLNSSMFYFNGTDPYICADVFETQFVSSKLLTFDSGESYLSLCGLIFSILSLTITLIIYCILQELRNIPGKVLICLITSLILAQTTFLLTSRARNHYITCKSLAIIVHYFYLATFTWMNMIAVDLLVTFSRSFKVIKSNKKSKRFYLYSVYGWFVPMVLVAVAVGTDESSNVLREFKPGYGQDICWITSKNALILFFIGPLALFKLIDIIGFILTSCFIARARHQGSRANKTKKLCSFFLYIKLSAVMGLTWVFAFLAMFTNSTVTWYIFIVFNTLQGVFIAASFLCTRKVFNLLRNKILKKRNVALSTTLSTLRK